MVISNTIIYLEKEWDMNKRFRRMLFSSLQLSSFILWNLKLDFLISKFFGIITVCYNKKELKQNKNKTAILAMERNIFDFDVKALKRYPSKYIIIVYPTLARALLSDEAEWLLPKEILEQTSFYAKKDKYINLYDRLSRLYCKTLDTIESFANIDIKIVLTANIDYFQDYPWIKSIHQKKGKFVVLEKESIIFKEIDIKNLTNRHRKYGFLYEGDAVLFYTNLAKKIYCKIGSVKPNQAFVTGSPRVDRLTSISKKQTGKSDFFLLSSFLEPRHFGSNVFNEILDEIYKDDLLKKKVIVKCKYPKEVMQVNKSYQDISAVYDSVENYLIKNPAIFIGYNSTICFDALIAGIPVVVPYWGEIKNGNDEKFLGEHTSSFHLLAYSKDSLVKIIKDYLTNNTKKYMKTQTVWNNSKLKKYLEHRYSRVDGNNCKRVFEVIDEILKKSNH